MKTLKKSMGIILAVLMTVLFTTSAFATEEKVDVKNRQYYAYQIFSGTQGEAEEGEIPPLCDIVWGTGIDNVKFLAKITAMESGEFAGCKSADDVAKKLKDISDTINNNPADSLDAINAKKAVDEFARLADICKTDVSTDLGTYADVVDGAAVDTAGVTLESKLTPGYYLIVDMSATAGDDTAKNLSLLQMTKNGELVIGNKTDIPMVEKKVWENSYANADEAPITNYQLETGYNDIADHNIGDKVPFMLIGTMPSTLKDYDNYTYIFHDTMSKGLTYSNDAIVYVDNADGNGPVVVPDTKYTIESKLNAKTEGTDLTISFEDVKLVDGINEKSKIVVKYTALLNSDAIIGLDGNTNEVYLEYSNNPNFDGTGEPGGGDDDGDSDDTGKSKEDKVIVFTYKLDVKKVDQNDQILPGAVFTLKNNDTNKYYALDDDGNVYWTEIEDEAYKLKSTTEEYFTAKGLDEGSYTLTEVAPPAGYDAIAPITFTIEADTANDTKEEAQYWVSYEDAKTALEGLVIELTDHTSASIEAQGDISNGSVKLKVVNNPGSLLPETGGMGTVLIYTIGAILALGSIVLLVAKKRMNK